MVNYKEFNDRLVNIINEGVAKDMIIVDGWCGQIFFNGNTSRRT